MLTPMTAQELPERRFDTDAEAKALASGLRLRILRLTLDEALTNKEIAEALDRNPASVLHHVRTLVETGFLRAEPERRGPRGSREIPYRATGKSWDLKGHNVSSSVIDAFLEEVETLEPADLRLSRMRIAGEDIEEFRVRMRELLLEFHHRPRDTQNPYSVFVALHPDTSYHRR